MLITKNVPWESLPLIFAGRAAAFRDERLLEARREQDTDVRSLMAKQARRWHHSYLGHIRKYWQERTS